MATYAGICLTVQRARIDAVTLLFVPIRCVHAVGGLELAEPLEMAGMDSTHNLESLPTSFAIKSLIRQDIVDMLVPGY